MKRLFSSGFTDPITGDSLTLKEYLTRQIQVVVRTPWFIVAFNVITIVCMKMQHMVEWNDFASWLAVMIEWLVGTYFFGQTGRDAIILRELRTVVRHQDETIQLLVTLVKAVLQKEDVIEETLEGTPHHPTHD